jgi:hypothetical protein
MCWVDSLAVRLLTNWTQHGLALPRGTPTGITTCTRKLSQLVLQDTHYLVLTTMMIIFLLDGIALFVERSQGKRISFLYSPRVSEFTSFRTLEGDPLFLALEPILLMHIGTMSKLPRQYRFLTRSSQVSVRYGLQTYNKRIVMLGARMIRTLLTAQTWHKINLPSGKKE